MAVLTPDRSGLARSGATRAGYPILVGVRVKTYALSGVARSKACRSNYTSPALFVSIAGTHYATGRAAGLAQVDADSLTITETNNAPNTATLTTRGFLPSVGQTVIITLGSKNNLKRFFAGTILTDTRTYVGVPAVSYSDALTLIDFTGGMLTPLVTGQWVNTPADVIAKALIAQVSGYTSNGVQANLPTVTTISITDQDLPSALSQLVKAAGLGGWRCDYFSDIKLWLTTDTSETAPTILNAVHPTLTSFSAMWDVSQTATRARVQGGGTNSLVALAAGQTVLPVQSAAWYPAAGVVASGKYQVTTGVLIVGQNRLTYTGVTLGGPGSLVGPGVGPASPPTLTPVSGAGIEAGVHNYAVTFVTAAGESLPSPIVSIDVESTTSPPGSLVLGTPTIGTGPNAGSHDYAVTFTTASGETTPGPRATQATGLTPAPTTAPTPGTPTPGTGVDSGDHDYAVSFVTSIGETTPSPISVQVTTGNLPPPGPNPPTCSELSGAGVDAGTHGYAITFVTSAGGETTPGPIALTTVAASYNVPAPGTAPTSATVNFGATGWVAGDVLYAVYTYIVFGETTPSANSNSVTAALIGGVGPAVTALQVSVTASADPNVNFIRVYINKNGSWWGYTDVVNATWSPVFSNAQFAGSPPGANTATVAFQKVLVSLYTGPAGVTSRKVYRSTAGGTQLELVATIADNTTTGYLDSTADAALGANVPTSNTAAMNQVPLTGIQLGDANVTSRKLYRRSGGLGLKFLHTIADNTTTTYTDTTSNAGLGAAVLSVSTAYLQRIALSSIPLGLSALVTGRQIYRTAAGGGTLLLLATLADNTTTTYADSTTDAGLGAAAPGSNTATANQVSVTAIPIGQATVTQRKVYRTATGGTQLKLLHTIADNTTVIWADSAADATLGANVPVGDTSGLLQPTGNVIAGSTSLQAAGVGWATAAGGWAVIGNGTQVIQYTGITGNTLTGIPASGVGAIVATVSFNSTITAAALLTGIPASGAGSVLYPILVGDPVYFQVQVDDLAAQTVLAGLVGGSGVRETLLVDNRIAVTEAIARGKATLALQSTVTITLPSYTVRDINTAAGRTVAINLGAPFSLNLSMLLQAVTVTGFQPQLCPTFVAQGSSLRFTFEDLLRLMVAA